MKGTVAGLLLIAGIASAQQVVISGVSSPGNLSLSGTELCVAEGRWTGARIACVDVVTGADRSSAPIYNFPRGEAPLNGTHQTPVAAEANDQLNRINPFLPPPNATPASTKSLPIGTQPYGTHWVDAFTLMFSAFGSNAGPMTSSSVFLLDTITGTRVRVAGNGTWGYNGDGMAATVAALRSPHDTAGTLSRFYIADYGSNRVRLVENSMITTVVGNGAALNTGDGGPATQASINAPTGLALCPDGTLYIGTGATTAGQPGSIRYVRNGIIRTLVTSSSPVSGIATDCTTWIYASLWGFATVNKWKLPGAPTPSATPQVPTATRTVQPTASPSAEPIRTVDCACVGSDLICHNVCAPSL